MKPDRTILMTFLIMLVILSVSFGGSIGAIFSYTFNEFLFVNGTNNMNATLNMSWHNISNVVTSAAPSDATNVSFVLAHAGGGSSDAWNDTYYLRDTSRSLTGAAISRDVNDETLSVYGGTAIPPYGGIIQLYGGDNPALNGGMNFGLGDALGAFQSVMWIEGRTNTPFLNMNSHQIKDMADPTDAQDAATKAYVDLVNATGGAFINNSYYPRDNSLPLTSEKVRRDVDNDLLSLYGGDAIAGGTGILSLYGKTSANPNDIEVVAGDAAGVGNTLITSWRGGAAPVMDMNGYNITGIMRIENATDVVNLSYMQNTIWNNATLSSSINESYAYLPGRAGGQVLNGGTAQYNNLTLNATTNNGGNVIILPNGGGLGVGTFPSTFVRTADNYINASATGLIISLIGQSSALTTVAIHNSNPNSLGGGIGTEGAAVSFSASGVGMGSIQARKEKDFTTTVNRSSFLAFATRNENSLAERMRIIANGNITTNYIYNSSNLNVQSVRIFGLGAGTMMTDALGNVYIISDEKYKTDVVPFTSGLAAILKTNPINYKFNAASGLDTQNTYTGFSAQQLKTAIPDAVYSKPDVTYEQVLTKPEVLDGKSGEVTEEAEYTTVEKPVLDKDGKQTSTLSISDRAIIATLVNAVKEQQVQIDRLNKVCGVKP